ncbi:MAG: hydroxymethylglutaryl-CoA lyase [Bacteroidia bacterium]|nr:hydroxymethylglutaryl-CoA lyase [Bacteroidia bacterium]
MIETVHLTECPRDAMQGLHEFIPTEKKIAYLNALLECGFDTLDFGSFVSPKAIPQMRDTAEVLNGLRRTNKTDLLAIVANKKGAEDACRFEEIRFLGFPFSISETFQRRNTNASVTESLLRVEEICSLAANSKKKVLIYISMAFGNPYGDPWNGDIALQWTEKLSGLGIEYFAMADTIGASMPATIRELFSALIPAFPKLKIGAHLHTTPESWKEKLQAAWDSGCRRFDSAIRGYGGCPMATDKLTGNMPTENVLNFLREKQASFGVNSHCFDSAMQHAVQVFPG